MNKEAILLDMGAHAVIPAFRRQRQDSHEFQARMGYNVRLCSKKKTKKKEKERKEDREKKKECVPP